MRQVNHEMLVAWWHIGREIVEQVQEGEGRAAYGRQVLQALSKRLTERYGRGFSFTNLKYFRLFYRAYATRETQGSRPCQELDLRPRNPGRTG